MTSRAAEVLKHHAAGLATDLAGEAKRASGNLVEQRVFGLVDDVANAVRTAARELENGQHGALAQYAYRAADEITDLRQRFGGRDVGEFIRNAEHLARTRPVAALGVAFAAGFALVRFLKSSAEDRTGEYGGGEYGGRETFGAYGTSYERPSSAYSGYSAYGGEDRQSEREREMHREGTGSYGTGAAQSMRSSQQSASPTLPSSQQSGGARPGASGPGRGTAQSQSTTQAGGASAQASQSSPSSSTSSAGQTHGASRQEGLPERSRRDPAEG
jgi:hypothetical protein